ncbi:MAG TPA: TetR/AcrR family transcriptional regulator [Rhodospirillaceae bacterium]|nr:TetR/AcrR family transcriptional regulator [Rhodospirillaceae bacterium]
MLDFQNDDSPASRTDATLDALEDIFLKDGFRKVTVAQLARALRCSRRTLYELAPTKEDLFLLVLERYLARVRGMGDREAAVAASPDLAIAAYLRPAVSETRKIGSAFSADVAGFPRARKAWEAHMHQRMGSLRGLVEKGVEQGAFRRINAILVAEVMEASTRRLKDPDFLAATGLPLSEAFAELYHLLQHGLLAHCEPL